MVDSEGSGNDQRLLEDFGGEPPTSKFGQYAVANMAANGQQSVVELVPDRTAAHDAAAVDGDEIAGRHSIGWQADTVPMTSALVHVTDPIGVVGKIEGELEAFGSHRLLGGPDWAFVIPMQRT